LADRERHHEATASQIQDCPFKVVKTNGSDEVPARSVNLIIGKTAFETAKRLYPWDVMEYRNGAQVIERSEG
jgi:hypothetical protein